MLPTAEWLHDAKRLPINGKYTWQNTATGYVAHARYNTYAEAQEVIDYMVKEIHERSTTE